MHGKAEDTQQTESISTKQSNMIEEKQNHESEQPMVTQKEEPAEHAHNGKSKPLIFLGVAAMAAMMLLMIL